MFWVSSLLQWDKDKVHNALRSATIMATAIETHEMGLCVMAHSVPVPWSSPHARFSATRTQRERVGPILEPLLVGSTAPTGTAAMVGHKHVPSDGGLNDLHAGIKCSHSCVRVSLEYVVLTGGCSSSHDPVNNGMDPILWSAFTPRAPPGGY